MSEATLLVELLTEELPPKSLSELASAFADKVTDGLLAERLVQRDASNPVPLFDPSKLLATPRRLAILVPDVLASAGDASKEVDGPPVTAKPEAVAGFAKKQGVDPSALQQRDGPKGKIYFAKVTLKGATLDTKLAGIVADAVKKLPIPKVMRWGDGEAQFVRPAHGLVMLHGTKIVPGEVLGLQSGNKTRGHRFMSTGEIALSGADEYEQKMLSGKVVVDFGKRKVEIERQLQAEAKKLNASLGEYQALLDEVTALVEHPSVYVGEFDKAFLEVPQECLILTMQQHQRYFPLFDAAGKLTGKFLIVSNMQVADPRHIIGGNQRVVRPRLEDARFFYDQDRKQRLEERVPLLAKVVYHNKLGSQLDRVQRIKLLAGKIARMLGADALQAERAAELAKADLLTGMVGEFPELQGVMGRYYALHDKEPADVADAIEAHYRPRFAGDRLPEGPIACAVALADKLDAIAGMFSIGQQPTGDKDPFGLRRATLGAIRILVEHKLALSLKELIHAAFEPFEAKPHTLLRDFFFDRLSGYLKERGYSTLQVEAVVSKMPANLGVVPQQMEAVRVFQSLPEAESLASANKRIQNIMRQAKFIFDGVAAPDLMTEQAEKDLYREIVAARGPIEAKYAAREFTDALRLLAHLRPFVDSFFDKVMVNADDANVRTNRLRILGELNHMMNQVADISKLAA